MFSSTLLPPLPLAEWEATKTTLHLYLQIVGKIQLQLNPKQNHWWHITFYPVAKGICSQQIPCGDRTFEILFNFIQHRLEIQTSEAEYEEIQLLDGLSVASFYHQLFEKLHMLDIKVRIMSKPLNVPGVVEASFADINDHNTYNKAHVERFWKILLWTNSVFKEFSGRYNGKTSPVQLFWHHMDLVITRFSGRPVYSVPSSDAHLPNRKACSHECISFGFWPGDEDVKGAAFYCYTYPSPDGIDREPLQPKAAQWIVSNGSPMALLMYDNLRAASDPEGALLAFLESSYQAGIKRAEWEVFDYATMSY